MSHNLKNFLKLSINTTEIDEQIQEINQRKYWRRIKLGIN